MEKTLGNEDIAAMKCLIVSFDDFFQIEDKVQAIKTNCTNEVALYHWGRWIGRFKFEFYLFSYKTFC